MDLVFSYFYKQLFYVFGATKDINGCAETVNKGIENKKKKKKSRMENGDIDECVGKSQCIFVLRMLARNTKQYWALS